MRYILIVILASAFTPLEARSEVVSAPVELTVQVKDKNYHLARNELIKRAFATAVHRVAAGVIASSGGALADQEIQDQVAANAEEFVSSYKFLDESMDYAQETITANLEVTVNVSAILNKLKRGGASGKRKGKKIVALIHEERLSFLSKNDFLLLTSPSEETVAGAFRQNGYTVADRRQVRAAGMGPAALKALEGDRESLAAIGKELEADILLVGKAEVLTAQTAQGGKSIASIKASLHRASDGSTIAVKEELGEIETSDPAKGSLAAAQIAAQKTAREFLAVAGALP